MDLRAALSAHRLVAILRGDDHVAALRSIETLRAQGVAMIEISLTGKDAPELIAKVCSEFGPDALIGAGTVLRADQAAEAFDAGARFALTPALCPGVHACLDLGLPVVPGVYTASEVLQADALGAPAVKLFPAVHGGVSYLQALRAPFPEIAFVPVGGVDVDDTTAYLRAGAVAVGVGTPLLGDALSGGSQPELAKRARRFLAAARSTEQ